MICVLQLGNMFTMRDDVVPGYDAPTVITELHVHLQDMAVEYRLVICSVQSVLIMVSLVLFASLSPLSAVILSFSLHVVVGT